MLTPFGDGIWIAKGPVLCSYGFSFPTRCAVIKLVNGGVVIWSPVELTESIQEAIDAIGPVVALIAPNSFHHQFFAQWVEAYPDAKCFAAPRLREKRRDIVFNEVLEDRPDQIWAQDMAQVIVRGNLLTDEVVFFHKPSGTILFTDLLQQFDKGWFKGWRAIVARLDFIESEKPQVPRKFRWAFRDRDAARVSVKTILSWPAQQVLMAHGRPVTSDARGLLKRAFSWLTV
ncbi:uncharacterized protein DUF4336 [Pacificibacter maritimus]|uniref:Uncharacterized protein DUF4336 n=1 Tax=Pacificibacter maritimus TaxID=762213 RepID=A0A3N4UN68_9RHOB|nr:DUF4336 domain-containing protein [Pacificibacter maritimus]RPE71893.1 uncharacterized protein DUF4336 [Pacificibacter maritimus]